MSRRQCWRSARLPRRFRGDWCGNRRVGKGVLAPCPPYSFQSHRRWWARGACHRARVRATRWLCPPYTLPATLHGVVFDIVGLGLLTLLRLPAISLGAGPAHQHGPLRLAQAVGLPERLDGPLVVDDGERARPVRAPQAAIETPGI